MSQNSFPRKEHVEILIQRISSRLRSLDVPLEIVESGEDRFHCRYRFNAKDCAGLQPEELMIHFQIAERLLAGGADQELNRLVDSFARKLIRTQGSNFVE